MNTTITDELIEQKEQKPGAKLAEIRLQKGYSPEYVAEKLHLRVRLIELLEGDEYHHMPEPVFIKGYLRAYAKLLGVAAEPLLEVFNRLYTVDKKLEKALWQSRRETNHAEHAIRWLTWGVAFVVVVAVAVWWYSNKENERLFPTSISKTERSAGKADADIRLTDLSKMRSLLSLQSSNNNDLAPELGPSSSQQNNVNVPETDKPSMEAPTITGEQ